MIECSALYCIFKKVGCSCFGHFFYTFFLGLSLMAHTSWDSGYNINQFTNRTHRLILVLKEHSKKVHCCPTGSLFTVLLQWDLDFWSYIKPQPISTIARAGEGGFFTTSHLPTPLLPPRCIQYITTKTINQTIFKQMYFRQSPSRQCNRKQNTASILICFDRKRTCLKLSEKSFGIIRRKHSC